MSLQNLNDPNSLWIDSKDKSVGLPGRGQSSSTNETSGPNSSSSGTSSTIGTWNVEVFIKALLEVVPNINCKAVILKLDYKGFIVNDKHGLKLLFTALR